MKKLILVSAVIVIGALVGMNALKTVKNSSVKPSAELLIAVSE